MAITAEPQTMEAEHWAAVAESLHAQGTLQLQLSKESRGRVDVVTGNLISAYRQLFGTDPTVSFEEGENGELLVQAQA